MRFTTFLLKNLMRRKIRTLLTCGGVAVAVGATIAFLGIADGFERSLSESLSGKGSDIIVTEKSKLDPLSGELDEQYVQRIAAIDGVTDVAMGLLELIGYDIHGDTVPLLVQGWQADSFLMDSLEILKGSRLAAGDTGQLLIGVDLAASLKLGLGGEFELDDHVFRVKGIYRSSSEQENRSVVLLLNELQEVMLRPRAVTGFSIRVADETDQALVQRICDDINTMENEQGRTLKLSAKPTEGYVQSVQAIKISKGMAWLTSAVAILVGAIGMLNTMIMSVVERIKEISILRAIGWRKSRVVSMILGESLIIAMTGAALGTAGAVLVIRWLTSLPQASMIKGDISPLVIVEGLLLAGVVGVLGGLVPAFRAARLLPSEGLRHE